MRKFLFVIALFAAAAPCAAQYKDMAAAKTALASAKARDRLDAITYFGSLRSDEGYKVLAAHFPAEKDAYLRVQLVEMLDVSGSSWAYKCAGDAAADGNKAVRQASAEALARRAGDPAADAKIKLLAADKEENVRRALVRSLGAQKNAAAAAAIGGVLADRKDTLRVRQEAAEALAGMKTTEADAELLKHLSDADPKIKAAAMSRRPGKAKPAGKKN